MKIRDIVKEAKKGREREAKKKKTAQDLLREENSLREEIVVAYGGECVCCGITQKEFLTVYPVKNNAAEELRKFKGNVTTLYKSIIKRHFPKDEYQVLCWNCSGAIEEFGECPHERERRGAQT